jgi:DNA-binding NtrC family response regulator
MSSTPSTVPGLNRSPNHDLLDPTSPDQQDATILLGESAAVQQLRSQIQRVAPYLRTALIRGEAGSGKNLVARALHALSPTPEGPFIPCDASALASSIANGGRPLSSDSPAPGELFESARGGTLYLFGVGRLSAPLQAALVRFLRASEEHRTAAAQTARAGLRRHNPRILAASGQDLRTLAAIGQFRQDLYAHLSVVEISVPPLRQRMDDIPILTARILHSIAERTGKPPKILAESTLAQLQGRLWPGNLRDLERVLLQAASLTDGTLIEPRHLLSLVDPAPLNPAAPTAVKLERLHDVIQQHVLDVLSRCGGNKFRAAETLGISRSTLYRMLDSGAPNDPLPE